MTKRKRITEQVRFVGFKKEVAEEYHRADAVLMCSRDEGMGRVTVEAMSYGKPVLGYRGGATPELLTDEVDGFLYENDAKGLAWTRCTTSLEKFIPFRFYWLFDSRRV